MRCILSCPHWALAESTLDQGILPEPAIHFQVQYIMMTVRGFVVPYFSLRPNGVRSDNTESQVEMFVQMKIILEMRISSDAGSFGAFSSSNNTLSGLLNRLRALPYQMAEISQKPESAKDVLATLSAITALVECCDISFAFDEVGATRWVWRHG